MQHKESQTLLRSAATSALAFFCLIQADGLKKGEISMSARQFDFALAIGGAAGQGIATPGDILARIFVRRGLHLNTYNAYQSIVRGGHIFLTVRISDQPVLNHGDQWNLLLCLDQPTMDRHLRHMQPGTKVIFNSDAITPGDAGDGVELCAMPVAELTDNSRNTVMQNTVGPRRRRGADAHGFRGARDRHAVAIWPQRSSGGG